VIVVHCVVAIHNTATSICYRVPTPPGKSWIFCENSRTWKSILVLESPGNWRLRSWKNIFDNYAFFIGSNGKQAEIVNVPVCVDFYLFLKTTTGNILLHATVPAMDYTPNVVSERCFFFIFKHSWTPTSPWKISHGGPGKVLDFFSSERVGTLMISRHQHTATSHSSTCNNSQIFKFSKLANTLKIL